jgi:hypothetical protein
MDCHVANAPRSDDCMDCRVANAPCSDDCMDCHVANAPRSDGSHVYGKAEYESIVMTRPWMNPSSLPGRRPWQSTLASATS